MERNNRKVFHRTVVSTKMEKRSQWLFDTYKKHMLYMGNALKGFQKISCA